MVEIAHRTVKQLVLGLEHIDAKLKPLPRLSLAKRHVMQAIELAAGRPLAEVNFRIMKDMEPYHFMGPGRRRRILREMIADGYIDVVTVAPAIYRVTKRGKIAWGLR